jgi:hypothetical protein
VRPKRTIAAAERTNLWTVCLTRAGVLGYMNRRISPLGALLLFAVYEHQRGVFPCCP